MSPLSDLKTRLSSYVLQEWPVCDCCILYGSALKNVGSVWNDVDLIILSDIHDRATLIRSTHDKLRLDIKSMSPMFAYSMIRVARRSRNPVLIQSLLNSAYVCGDENLWIWLVKEATKQVSTKPFKIGPNIYEKYIGLIAAAKNKAKTSPRLDAFYLFNAIELFKELWLVYNSGWIVKGHEMQSVFDIELPFLSDEIIEWTAYYMSTRDSMAVFDKLLIRLPIGMSSTWDTTVPIELNG